ncbi:MAG TPA: hypothetical protein VFW11_22420 [Cyclobacteriaceae bacterium]|nr:hypothetical protein [Cyclobacteriaceae bacterium]
MLNEKLRDYGAAYLLPLLSESGKRFALESYRSQKKHLDAISPLGLPFEVEKQSIDGLLCLADELLNMGLADLDRSAAANSFAKAVMDYEKNQKRKARRMGSVIDNETAGRKYNVYNQSYMTWVQRLLPWLRKHRSIGNQKEALIFIGFLLEASGHDEFRRQYGKGNRETRKEVKVKSQSRWQEFETKTEDVHVPYREYLHNRMKTIMKRSETVTGSVASA